MPDTFIVMIDKDPATLVENAKFVMGRHSFVFSGDSKSGTFSAPVIGGKVEGKYALDEHSISVTVIKRPFFVPLSLIELAAHELFA